LLVIDEEQKFGVKQKEKLKEARVNTNILSMTATPIPRTLNMALSGVGILVFWLHLLKGEKRLSIWLRNSHGIWFLKLLNRNWIEMGRCIFFITE
jgi:hypothetical protein